MSKRPSNRGRKLHRSTREGVATVELALVLPVLFILIFGTLEVCLRLNLRESVVVAAYETARLASRRHGTADDAVARGLTLLEERGVRDGTIQIDPSSLVDMATADEIRVTATVPVAGNTSVSFVLPTSGDITVHATMLKE